MVALEDERAARLIARIKNAVYSSGGFTDVRFDCVPRAKTAGHINVRGYFFDGVSTNIGDDLSVVEVGSGEVFNVSEGYFMGYNNGLGNFEAINTVAVQTPIVHQIELPSRVPLLV